MKITSFILMIYVSTMILLPGLEAFGMVQESFCCVDLCDDENGENDEHENEGSEMCNPFLSCHCCFGFLPFENTSIIRQVPTFHIVKINYNYAFNSRYSSTIWIPPRA